MGKNFFIKISVGKPPNEMGNCPFASPLVAPLLVNNTAYQGKRLVSSFWDRN